MRFVGLGQVSERLAVSERKGSWAVWRQAQIPRLKASF